MASLPSGESTNVTSSFRSRPTARKRDRPRGPCGLEIQGQFPSRMTPRPRDRDHALQYWLAALARPK
jgi:hypothetical protein